MGTAKEDFAMSDIEKRGNEAPEEVASTLEMQGIPRGSYGYKAHSSIRKLIAKRMSESIYSAPHFSVDIHIEVDELMAMRRQVNAQGHGRVSLNDCFIKATAEALDLCPDVNVTFTEAGMVRHNHADVSFAVAIDGGLITPIVRRAEAKTLLEISAETQDLVARGRNKRLKPHEYFGGTFSLSNLGMFGVHRFDAIINQPQAAILSLGAPMATYVPSESGPRAANVMVATLTSDHRAIDGATAAKWLQELKSLLEAPAWVVNGSLR